MKVAVGSENPVKVSAVKTAFTAIWPQETWEIIPSNVPSGVRAQPLSDRESIRGATNRAKRALRKAHADFGVGLEGGLQKIGSKWFDSGWIVVIDKQGTIGIGSSIKMHTPEKVMKLIHAGMELGEVSDHFFKIKNSKQQQGHFGLMTNNALTREEAYTHAIICALARFLHPEIFTEET